MKKERAVGIVIATVNAILIIVCAVLYLGMDRTEPRFEFQASNTIYREGMDISGFINGISVYDDEDGDITDRIVVEKLIENRAENSVIVFYAVSDKAGNVAKCSREFAAIFIEETENENSPDILSGRMPGYEGETEEGWLVQAGFWNDLGGGREKEVRADTEDSGSGEKTGEEEDSASDGENEEKEGENRAAEEESGGRRQTSEEAADSEEKNNREEEDSQEEERTAADRETQRAAEQEESIHREEQEGIGESSDRGNRNMDEEGETAEKSAPPVLTLQVSEVKTQAGIAPAWVQVIGTLTDDRDSYETLFRNLEISKYNVNEAGTYQVTVSTRDSDGNRSQAVPLTIIVR